MTAYIIVRIEADNPELLRDYQMATPPVVEKYRGRFIVRGGPVITLEGPEETRRIVILEFPEMKDAEAFYHSPEYAEAKKLREKVSIAEFIAVYGYAS